MVIKVYISGISGNKEVKKRQQRVLMILDSKNIKYEEVDIAEPGKEEAKEFMQNNSKSLGATVSDPTPRSPLPPQIYNDDDYCGDYDQFDLANEIDEIEKFLKMPVRESTETTVTSNTELKLGNGEIEPSPQEEIKNSNDVEVKEDVQDNLKEPPNEIPKEDGEINSNKTENELEPDEKIENGDVKESDSQPTEIEA